MYERSRTSFDNFPQMSQIFPQITQIFPQITQIRSADCADFLRNLREKKCYYFK